MLALGSSLLKLCVVMLSPQHLSPTFVFNTKLADYSRQYQISHYGKIKLGHTKKKVILNLQSLPIIRVIISHTNHSPMFNLEETVMLQINLNLSPPISPFIFVDLSSIILRRNYSLLVSCVESFIHYKSSPVEDLMLFITKK